MSYIYDPVLVDLLGKDDTRARARDDRGRWLTTPHRQTGLWCVAGIPHTGWTCIKVAPHMVPQNPDEPVSPTNPLVDGWSHVCEMCAVTHIKYVHTMVHPEHDGPLLCGCVCAGIMQQNHEAAAQYEKHAKAIERARQRHADGLKIVAQAEQGVIASEWNKDEWWGDDDWPKVRGTFETNRWTGKRRKCASYMSLEGISDFCMSVNRRGLDGYGANVGHVTHGRPRLDWHSPKPHRTVAAAKLDCARTMAARWIVQLDRKLEEVIDRNRVVNDLGDVIAMG